MDLAIGQRIRQRLGFEQGKNIGWIDCFNLRACHSGKRPRFEIGETACRRTRLVGRRRVALAVSQPRNRSRLLATLLRTSANIETSDDSGRENE